MTILCVIGARGGSQGLPGKNIKPLLGKPLIVWSIEQALATPEIDRVIVSTDLEEIAKVSRDAGAEIPFLRPDELAGPEVGKFQVWQHALDVCEKYFNEKYEALVDLDCTSPLRSCEDISNAISQFRASRERNVDAIFSVCKARKNPYFNMVESEKSGALRTCKSLRSPVIRRQDAPQVYEHVASIYVLSPVYLRSANHLLDGHAEGYDISEEKNMDIDSELDFELVEFMMKRKY